jgi:hypothetical protein
MGTTDDRFNRRFRVHRPFVWGILLIGDSASPGVPATEPGVAVVATRTVVAIGVRHAQDVDFEPADDGQEVPQFSVTVEVRLGQLAETAVHFDDVIEVPSGRITVGDADREQSLLVTPGPWRIQLALTPEDQAEKVDVWITKAL